MGLCIENNSNVELEPQVEAARVECLKTCASYKRVSYTKVQGAHESIIVLREVFRYPFIHYGSA